MSLIGGSGCLGSKAKIYGRPNSETDLPLFFFFFWQGWHKCQRKRRGIKVYLLLFLVTLVSPVLLEDQWSLVLPLKRWAYKALFIWQHAQFFLLWFYFLDCVQVSQLSSNYSLHDGHQWNEWCSRVALESDANVFVITPSLIRLVHLVIYHTKTSCVWVDVTQSSQFLKSLSPKVLNP